MKVYDSKYAVGDMVRLNNNKIVTILEVQMTMCENGKFKECYQVKNGESLWWEDRPDIKCKIEVRDIYD